jgi:phosphoglycolate phosphatase
MAWNKALERMQINNFRITGEEAALFSGKLLEEIFAAYFPFVSRERYKEMANTYAEEEAFHMKNYVDQLYPNTREALEQLVKDHRLFIVSNCLSGYIENFLQMHRLESLFTDYACSGTTGKPKSENIAMIISRNGLKSPVYIGDTPGDFEASSQNSIPFVHAGYGFREVPEAEYRINSLMELGDALRKINS